MTAIDMLRFRNRRFLSLLLFLVAGVPVVCCATVAAGGGDEDAEEDADEEDPVRNRSSSARISSTRPLRFEGSEKDRMTLGRIILRQLSRVPNGTNGRT
jgi:hypothetical protein